MKSRMILIVSAIAILLCATVGLLVNMVDGLTSSMSIFKKMKAASPELEHKAPATTIAVVDDAALPDASETILDLAHSDPNATRLRIVGQKVTKSCLALIIQKLPKLKTIAIVNSQISDDAQTALQDLRKLSINLVDLNETSVSGISIHALSEIATLDTIMLDSTGITDASFATLSRMHKLKNIRAAHNNLSDAAVKSLVPLADRLESLSIEDNKFSPAVLQELEKFQKLKSLNIGNCGLSIDDLCLLGKLNSLQHLSLTSQNFGKANLVPLAAALNQIEVLNLSEAKIDSKQYLTLARMKKLRQISVTQNAGLTAYGMNEFKRLRPDVFVLRY